MVVSRDSRYDAGDLVVLGGRAGARGRAGTDGARSTGRSGGSGGRVRVERRLGRPDVARDVIEALMVDRGLRALVRSGGRAGRPDVRGECRARRGRRPPRPACAADVHDRSGQRARFRRRDLSPRRGGRPGVARLGAHRRRHRVRGDRARRSIVRHTGAEPASTFPARSSRCCRRSCRTVPARWWWARTGWRSPSRWWCRGAVVERPSFYRSVIRSDAAADL